MINGEKTTGIASVIKNIGIDVIKNDTNCNF